MNLKSLVFCLWSLVLVQLTGADVLLDDFANHFGGANDQCHIGEAFGFSIGGQNNIDTGGGWWRPFTDTLGTVITSGSGTTLDSSTYPQLVDASAMHIFLKTHLSNANIVDTWPYAYMSCNMVGNDYTYFDFSNLTSIKLTVKGSGTIRIAFRTKDICDLFVNDTSAWGFYGYTVVLTTDWKEVIIPTALLTPESLSPPADSSWAWDHGKGAVKTFEIYAIPDDDTATYDSTDLYVQDITFIGLDWKEDFNFEYIELPQLTATPGDGTHFIIDTAISLSTAITVVHQIYYTTDGSEPDTSNASQLYSTPFTVSGDTVTVKAVIVVNGTILESKTWTYFQDVIAVTVTATPGDSTHFDLDTTVTLLANPADASIHYTLDGTLPTTGSPLYTGPITIKQNTLLRVMAYKAGYIGSYGSWSYICDLLASWIIANPGDSTSFTDSLHVKFTTNADTVYYTTDGSDPSTSGILYTGTFRITGDTVIVKAIAVGDGYDTTAGSWIYFGNMTGIGGSSKTLTCNRLSLQSYFQAGYKIILTVGIPDNATAQLVIFNLAGRKIFEQTIQGYGFHTVTIPKHLIGKGVYLCRLMHGDKSITQKSIIQ